LTLKLQVTKKKEPNSPSVAVPAVTFEKDKNTGIFMVDSAMPGISFSAGGIEELKLSLPSTSAELMDLFIQGKDVIKDKKEYLEVILRLPYVQGDNLKAIEVFERWKKTQRLLNTAEVKDE